MTLPLDLDAVIFDCDGLLVDTETCWTRAETALFAAHGHPFGPAQKQLVIGKTLEAAGEAMAGYFGRPGAGPELAQRLSDLVAVELAGGAAALPGARELVLAVRDRRPVAVASNSPRPFVTAALTSAGLADLFTHSLAAEDVASAKPAPDLYLAACARLGADPARSVAFEDSPTGVASARAASLFVVGVPSLPGALGAQGVPRALGAQRVPGAQGAVGVGRDGDALFPALTDPALTAWAHSLINEAS